MQIADIIALLLFSLGVCCLTVSIIYYRTEVNAKNIATPVFWLGFFSAMWAISSGCIPYAQSLGVVRVLHIIDIMGIDLFILALGGLLCRFLKINGKAAYIYNSILISAGLLDFYLFGLSDIYQYVFDENTGRMMYKTIKGFGSTFHGIYMTIVAVVFMTMHARYVGKLKLLRQKRMMNSVLLAACLVLLFSLPSVYYMYSGVASIPSAAYGGVLAFLIIVEKSRHYNAANITLINLTNEIFNISHCGILIFNMTGHLTDSNKYATDLLKMPAWSEPYGTEIFSVGEEEFKKIVSAQEGETYRWQSVNSGVLCSVTPSVILDEHKEPFCVICSVYDLTEEEKMRREIIVADKAKSSFLANMSHEIRTPINAILGMNEMIIRENTDKQVLEYAADIEAAGKSLLSLINDILDFSKIESGKLDIIPVDYLLKDTLRNPIEMVRLRAEEKKLELKLNIDENMPAKLFGDEIRIRQVMTNILINAVKYTKEGTVTVNASCEIHEKDNAVLVYSVSDTGIGIKEENLENLFNNSFQRLDQRKNRNIEGTGLGLTITNQLVHLMQGEISVESVYGEGSTFTVRIPQMVLDPSPMGSISKRENLDMLRQRSEQFTAPDARVLVVDDVPANLKVFKFLIKKTKIGVDLANSGAEALELVKLHVYDIIFMDHMMPEMDGVEALAEIKKLEDNANHDIPVVMLTANAITGAREEYLKAGFSDYLSKPIVPEELDAVLKKYLQKKK